MALDEDQLAIVLQASVDRAGELLRNDGGFLPFAARAQPGGEIEFVQIARDNDAEPLDALLDRLGEMLADEAHKGVILGSALVANARVEGKQYPDAIMVLVEAPGFCRSIMVPYRLSGGDIELGEMSPEAAAPAVFAGVAEGAG